MNFCEIQQREIFVPLLSNLVLWAKLREESDTLTSLKFFSPHYMFLREPPPHWQYREVTGQWLKIQPRDNHVFLVGGGWILVQWTFPFRWEEVQRPSSGSLTSLKKLPQRKWVKHLFGKKSQRSMAFVISINKWSSFNKVNDWQIFHQIKGKQLLIWNLNAGVFWFLGWKTTSLRVFFHAHISTFILNVHLNLLPNAASFNPAEAELCSIITFSSRHQP